ncbi:DNA gyrase subunit A [bacterium]|nr:DNA gyrase subunit A [bacterium]|tara:strand:+ start:2717 stop:5221 length:2505 start_codon:yes stop_codon:yes gene_type:complete
MVAKKKPAQGEEGSSQRDTKGVVNQGISSEMREAYLNYAMSVITSRALPDVRDGLKPVHRRILFAMHNSGLSPSSKTKKSATVVGDVIGKYHPHGDTAVYDSMVNLAQDFTMRYPLVIGQGNFGSIDGDPAAAYRYTEAKMSHVAIELLRDLGKNTVDFRPNFDNTHKEPVVLPASVPNLLLNGTLGIAVGMATNIPPHNFREVADAVVHLIDNPKSTTEDLLKFVQGPDFPTGCIAFNQKDITRAYATGRGGVVVRGEAEIVEDKRGTFQIVITSIPYRVNKANLITKIADLVHAKKLEGVKGLRDESTTDIRVVIDLKGTAHPQSVLNYLYKHTQLEDTFHYNLVALVDGVPKTLSLKAMLESYIAHRVEVVTRRTQFDLDKAKAREHILLGLKKALDNIDKVIALIKKSKDVPTAHAALMKTFKFSDVQATAILDMRLQKLANLERKKIDDELKELKILIKELESLLKSEAKLKTVIKTELKEVAGRLGDERRTKIMKRGTKDFSMEDIIPDDEYALVLTKGGYIKRTNPSEYRRQRRGGVGVIDMNTKEEDVVTSFLTAGAHSDLLFFTDKGKVYQTKMYEIPEGKRSTKGKSIMNFLQLEQDESVTSILPMPKDVKKGDELSLLMVTLEGTVKKTSAEQFHEVRRSGLIAIKLKGKDRLISSHFLNKGDDVVLVTRNGQAIRFKESDVREMGRTAAGVRGIKLGKGDVVVGTGVVEKDSKGKALFVLSSTGYGKKTQMREYKVQKRAGSGIKTSQVTAKTKEIIGAEVISREGGELVAISKKGQVIRTSLNEVKLQGRQTQGVRIMKLRAGDSIASAVTLSGESGTAGE